MSRRVNKSYVTPGLVCPYCQGEMDRSMEMYDDGGKPRPGDVTLCAYCAKVSVFNDELDLRKPTMEETLRFTRDPLITTAQLFIAGAPRR